MNLDDALADLIDAHPRAKISRETLAVYRRYLEDLGDAVADTIKELVVTSEFFPTIAEIRRAHAERVLGLPTAEAALAMIQYRATGEPHALPFQVAEALRLCGGTAAYRTTDKPGVWRAQFLSAYSASREGLIREIQVGGPALIERGST